MSGMEFGEVVRARRMCRRFDPDRAVPEAALREALGHARRAPSAGFSQGWDFVVLRGPGQTAPFWDAALDPEQPADRWLRGVRPAPVLVVCCADKDRYLDRYAAADKGWTDRSERNWPVPYWDVDTGMAALLMLLTAVDQGLGGLFFGVPAAAHAQVKEALGIPANRRLVGVVALGYASATGPSESAAPAGRPRRRPDREVIHWGRFGGAPPGAGV